jgi:hypothetical protein
MLITLFVHLVEVYLLHVEVTHLQENVFCENDDTAEVCPISRDKFGTDELFDVSHLKHPISLKIY